MERKKGRTPKGEPRANEFETFGGWLRHLRVCRRASGPGGPTGAAKSEGDPCASDELKVTEWSVDVAHCHAAGKPTMRQNTGDDPHFGGA
ncbi:hypothetical protein B0T26DRAFT_717848 [Lasiosphaeria miniovina]|uniref:Uncharacterized protein n=1 Tax=Lasiosphaeria miniovina TaxID=1954250 RepID=A0AA40ACW7_9PEZI|nr:uncharacterized protein B0T26DRAFT_717848 [Lasiosphaeria miniovina]KAK0713579.1 hypothetical protein B0T26DRAFT_717848 [Lasiosphaeria miniovina]